MNPIPAETRTLLCRQCQTNVRLDRARRDKPKEFAQTPLPFGVAETLNGGEMGQALEEGSEPPHIVWRGPKWARWPIPL